MNVNEISMLIVADEVNNFIGILDFKEKKFKAFHKKQREEPLKTRLNDKNKTECFNSLRFALFKNVVFHFQQCLFCLLLGDMEYKERNLSPNAISRFEFVPYDVYILDSFSSIFRFHHTLSTVSE